MNDKAPENKRTKLDAEFEKWRARDSLIGPAQLVAVEVYDMIPLDGPQRDVAIESLVSALERGQKDQVEAWVRQNLGLYVARMEMMGKEFASQVVVEMFEHYVRAEHHEGLGLAITAGGNENLAALRARTKAR
jgi:hypothetical protein